MASWRTGTTKQYDVYLKRWEQFCQSKGINRFDANVENGIDFLATLFTSGLGYSAINTARSALSSVLILPNNITFGAHPLVARFLKGVFELKPSLPRYSSIWDVSSPSTPQILRTPNTVRPEIPHYEDNYAPLFINGPAMSDPHEAGYRPYARTSRATRLYYWRQTQNHLAREAPRTHRTTGISKRRVDLRSFPLEAVHSVYKISSSDARYQAAYQLYKAAQASLQLHRRKMGQKCSKGLRN